MLVRPSAPVRHLREGLNGQFRLRHSRRGLGAAGLVLKLGHVPHHFLALGVERLTQPFDHRVPFQQPQLEPGDTLLQLRLPIRFDHHGVHAHDRVHRGCVGQDRRRLLIGTLGRSPQGSTGGQEEHEGYGRGEGTQGASEG